MIDLQWNGKDLDALRKALSDRVVARALRKAGRDAARDMRSTASKRIRQRKRLKVKEVRAALVVRTAKGRVIDGMEWAIDVRGKPVPLSKYPHRQTKKGVSVTVNRGKRTLIKSAFVATMRSGHKGVFIRRGARRLPIDELFGSRPVDALLHEGEADAVLERGQASFVRTFHRVLPLEIEKAGG